MRSTTASVFILEQYQVALGDTRRGDGERVEGDRSLGKREESLFCVYD